MEENVHLEHPVKSSDSNSTEIHSVVQEISRPGEIVVQHRSLQKNINYLWTPQLQNQTYQNHKKIYNDIPNNQTIKFHKLWFNNVVRDWESEPTFQLYSRPISLLYLKPISYLYQISSPYYSKSPSFNYTEFPLLNYTQKPTSQPYQKPTT